MRVAPLTLPLRPFGTTALRVPALGFGAGHAGGVDLTDDEAGTLLNRAVDLGLTFVDTAPGYGLSEERIGRHLSYRRHHFVLATKCGYGVPGHADWTPGCIRAGIDRALNVLRTDYLDIMLLHSCPKETLAVEGVVEALEEGVRAGKIRAAGYSGDNEALAHALASGRFPAVETSINLFDQRSLWSHVPRAVASGAGVVAKRPLGNAPWRFAERPTGRYAEAYWERLQTMSAGRKPRETAAMWENVALRFTAFAPGVATAIVGTSNVDRLQRNVDIVQKGPLGAEGERALREAFERVGKGWEGLV